MINGIYGVIYKITAPNGKAYIGQHLTSVNAKLTTKGGRVSLSLKMHKLGDRMNVHRKKTSNCTILKRSIEKYAWENMKVEILLRCDPEQLNFYEQQMIAAWDTLAPNGLNCTTGGEAGKKVCTETRQKIGESLKAYYIQNIHHQKGKPGHKLTEETKLKMSKAMKDHYKNHGTQLTDEMKLKKKLEAKGSLRRRKSGKWYATIPKSWNDGKQKGLGLFDTEEEAWAAIAKYKAEHVGS